MPTSVLQERLPATAENFSDIHQIIVARAQKRNTVADVANNNNSIRVNSYDPARLSIEVIVKRVFRIDELFWLPEVRICRVVIPRRDFHLTLPSRN
ncbi:hypothetical protein D3C87_2005050 [compost metagenome]